MTRHKTTIDAYEQRWSAQITQAQTDYGANPAGQPANDVSFVRTLTNDLQPARVYLTTTYGQGVNITGDILVGEDNGTTAGDINTLYYRSTDTDVLTGSDNSDLIFGESGNDVIQGGLGDDVSYGGQGTDIYKYRPGDGSDIIVDDDDGKGAILYDPDGTPQILAVGTRDAQSDGSYTGPWQSLDQTITYTLNGSDLTIATPGGTLTIKDFNQANNDLNIRLIDLPVEPPAQGLAPITDITTNADNTLTTVRGTAAAEITNGTGINDDIFGNGGGDRLYGSTGDDWIIAGNDAANATLDGGTGRDILVGANGRDHLFGGPNDTTDTDDALYGGAGEDYLEGGGGNDVLTGGAGRDLLKGGDGDDYLFGSATARALDRTWSLTPTVPQLLAGYHLVGDTWILPPYTSTGFTGSFSANDGVGDVLFGKGGADYLNGGTGADYLDGGAGDDEYHRFFKLAA